MGICAVLFWSAFCGGALPRWVWFFICADLVLQIPADIEFYSKLFH